MSKPFLIAGNWKMYKTVGEAVDFVTALYQIAGGRDDFQDILLKTDWVICPSFIALERTVHAIESHISTLPHLGVGAQNMSSEREGAYTGDVSPIMLSNVGVQWVILGHSERRQYHQESSAQVNEKAKVAYENGLKPIICVGESLEQREAKETDLHIEKQVKAALDGFDSLEVDELVIAYEPIWAIGTGKTCDSSEANRVCENITKLVESMLPNVSLRVLYGGSVKPANAIELLSQPAISGALVGGASLDPESFASIIEAVKKVEPATASV